MADTDARLEEVVARTRRAEGFMSDAEFREEVESKVVRYLQALSETMIAVIRQNEVIIDLLKAQGEFGDLSDTR